MRFAVLIFFTGLALISALLTMRALDGHHWSGSLMALRLRLPVSLMVDDVSRFLEVVAAMTHPPKWSLLPYPPIAIEIVADERSIKHYVLAPRALEGKLLSVLRAG